MAKVWRLDWEEQVSYTAEIVADTEEEARRYFETGTGGGFYTEPESVWAEVTHGPTIEFEGEEV